MTAAGRAGARSASTGCSRCTRPATSCGWSTHPIRSPSCNGAITAAPYRYHARIELAAPLDALRVRIPPTVGVLEPIDDEHTMLTTGADDLHAIVVHVAGLGVDFRIHEPDALRAAAGAMARRLARAAGAGAPGGVSSG
jgi:hypothetical protein